jgi:type 1 glutamine amidotransferase
MKKLVLFLLLPALAALLPAQQPKIQALIITGQNIPAHDWRLSTPVLKKLLEDTGKFEVRVTEEFRGAGPETLAPYQVVIVNYYDQKKPDLRWGERTDAALANYVRSGKGLVVYHFSAAAFDGWTEFEQMCGGNWRPNNGHHSARHDFTLDVKDSDHPIMRGMKKSFPEPNDELYANLKWQPPANIHVLATAFDDYKLYTNKKDAQPHDGAGKNEPMLWTVKYGSGRVFVTALGHDSEAMKSAAFITTFTRGAEWAATGQVTIPVPPELAQ